MAITIRYQTSTKWATFFEMHEFATKQAAQHFLDKQLPKDASNVDIWWDDVGLNEPRQKPTWYQEPKLSTKWWDANKRPFSDGIDKDDRI